jgi:hypothetical protein
MSDWGATSATKSVIVMNSHAACGLSADGALQASRHANTSG